MNRNVESHFSDLPAVDIQRSIFSRPSSHKTTFNTGDLIPVYVDEVLPGDTFRVATSKVVRLQTLLTPIMDNMYLDTYWFFVPSRLVWTHWKEFCGENTAGAWAPETQYSMPKISAPSGGFAKGTIADYMGIPVGVDFTPSGVSPSLNYDHFPTSLPFRAYALICNEFFRDENLTDPLLIPTGDSMQTGSNGSSYVADVANGGMPFKVAKYHDYFTSCLPSPQKGDPVQIPLPQSYPGAVVPVLTSPERLTWDKTSGEPMSFRYSAYTGSEETGYREAAGSGYNTWAFNDAVNSHRTMLFASTKTATSGVPYAIPDNLIVNVPAGPAAGSFSVNDLRLAFQAQKMLERNARGGSRYIEILKSHFGVTSPDARLQRPEYLGGNRIPIQIHQVMNSAQGEQDFLGDLGAMSYTADVHADFEKSFTEHGYLLCLTCARYDHTYSQGLERMWTRNAFTDFYLPVFANIGEQPVLKDEIYCDGSEPEVFGYQEAWAEYRYKPNRVSAEMRPGIAGSLASWHLADNYDAAPTLSDSWIREDKTNVDRVLAVTSQNSNQILADYYFDAVVTRPMPMYSIPGLIDHN